MLEYQTEDVVFVVTSQVDCFNLGQITLSL